jgi:signal recognition particle subunit SRP54
MMVGLQGSGKTTSTAKLANQLVKKEKAKKPLLVGLDVYRPAAIDQLETLAKGLKFDFYANRDTKDVSQIANEALAYAKENGNDLILVDTAGRLQTDEDLMSELETIKGIFKPSEIIFVADAMSGQEIANVATEFHNRLKITSSIITKLDSDAKGGAALSIASLLGVKIVYIGTGEKIEDFEHFHPDRMASRLLGLGDIETLTEKAAEITDEKKQERMMRKMLSGQFDLDDLMESMKAMSKMGNLSAIGAMMPGLKISDTQAESAENKMYYFEVLINSMTGKEKKNPKLLKHPKRKDRIMKGSGREAKEFNELLRHFEKSQKQMKEMAKHIKAGRMPNMGGGGFNGMM